MRMPTLENMLARRQKNMSEKNKVGVPVKRSITLQFVQTDFGWIVIDRAMDHSFTVKYGYDLGEEIGEYLEQKHRVKE